MSWAKQRKGQRDELVFTQQLSKDPWCQPIVEGPEKIGHAPAGSNR